jgi:hypothetical protein
MATSHKPLLQFRGYSIPRHYHFSNLLVLAVAVAVLMISSANAFVPTSYYSKNIALPSGGIAEPSQLSSTSLAGIGSVVSRIRDSVTSKERSRDDLKIGIAGFYDRSSKLWEEGQCMMLILIVWI